MAEINKIKVGETTYGINPSWATGDGVTSPIKMGTAGALTIGTAGLISMSTAVSIGNSLYVDGGIVCQQSASFGLLVAGNNGVEFGANTIRIGSKASTKVDINGALYINGVAFDPTGSLGTSAPGLVLQDNHLILGSRIALGSASDFDVWIGTDGASLTYLCAGGIVLRGNGDISLGSAIGYQYEDNGMLVIGTGAMGAARSIAIGAPQNLVEITIGSMYNGHCGIQLVPSQTDGDSINMICGNSLIEFYSGGGIGIHESGNGLNIGTGGKGYVNMDNKVSIGGFLFETDKSTSKLTISYNGKKAEIQLN